MIPITLRLSAGRSIKRYGKNKDKREIKTHHYIISFEPEDRERGLTMERAQELCLSYAKAHFPGHQMLVCAHEDGHNQERECPCTYRPEQRPDGR